MMSMGEVGQGEVGIGETGIVVSEPESICPI